MVRSRPVPTTRGGCLKRDKSAYAIAREPYKTLHPTARMHHLRPSSRRGQDTECNLFPWNELAHRAWHRLFSIMTIGEVWPVIGDVHMLIFQTDDAELVREWCTPYRYHGKKSEQRDMATPQSVEELRIAWVTCFGGADLRSAQRLLRYMMLYMVLGRYADHTSLVYENRILGPLIGGLNGDPDREWAFRQCFGRLPGRASLRSLKKIIRCVRARARSIPIH